MADKPPGREQAEVPSALDLLSDSYSRLGDDVVPPGVAKAKDLARLDTLSELAWDAAGTYDSTPLKAKPSSLFFDGRPSPFWTPSTPGSAATANSRDRGP